jgi:hypothetical protein
MNFEDKYMDWTKAKTILIVALLVTNLFLIFLYAHTKTGGMANEDTLEVETIMLLKDRGITIKEDLPKARLKMAVLIVECDQPDQEVINRALAEQSPIYGKDSNSNALAERIAEEFLRSYNIWSSGIIVDSIDESEDAVTVTYRNEYEGTPIEDSYIKCVVKNGIVSDIDIFWLKPIRYGDSKKATISASAALIDLMRGKEPDEKVVVEKMELVYKLDPSDFEGEMAILDTALPAWKVVYNGDQIKYVPAYID